MAAPLNLTVPNLQASGVFSASTSPESLPSNPKLFQAPVEFAVLKEIQKGPEDVFVIHIQDAHSNLSGQQNLSKAINDIFSKYPTSLVLSEGGQGDCSLTALKSMAPSDIWQRIAKNYLVQGKIAGEEFLNLTSNRPMKIIGIEEMSLYFESVRRYAELAKNRQEALEYLARIEQLLAILKKKLYPAGLLDYESKKYFVKQGGGDIDFQAAFKGMRDLDADLSAFGNLSAFERLLNNEKGIDFNAANLEQALLLEQLVKKGLKDDLESALGEIKSNKEKNISLFAYFQNTFRICLKNNISIEAYPNLIKYAEYLKSFSEIDLDKLLQEHQQAEDRLYRDLLKGSADARRIRAVDRFVKLLETAFKIQMSADEFRLFKANETDYTSLAMLAFLNKQLALEGRFENILGYHSALEEAKQHLNAFYESVQKRDDAFIANLDQSIKSEKQKIVILISGGYHTQNLKKLFRDKGYSYAVLAPKVTEATNQKKYEKLLLEPLMGKKSGPQGANPYRNRKSISALESDLLKGSKPKDGVRAMLAMAALALGDSQKSTVYSMARDAAILTGQEPDKFKGDVYKLAAARLASQESSASVTAGTTLRGVTSEWHLRNVRPAALDKEKEYLKLPLSLQPYRPRIHYSRRYSRHEILEELDGGDIDAQTLRLPQNRKGIAGPIRTVLLRSFYTTSVSNGEIYEDNLLVLNKDAKDPRTLGVVQLLDKKKEGIFETIYIKSFAREAIVQRALTLCLLYQGKIRRMVCTRCNAGAIDMCRRMTTDDRLSYDVVGTTYTFWKKGLEAGARLAKAPRPIEGHFSEPIRQMSEELARERGLVRRLRRKWEPAVVVFGSARILPENPAYHKAMQFGRLVYEKGWAIRSGAGPSLMEAPIAGYRQAGILDRSGQKRGFPTQGVRIRLPFEQKTSEYIQDNYFFAHFVNRKLALYNNSRAVVCFPGGFGTADEFFEVWVWTQTKGINLVLVGKDFWLPILKKFEERWTRSGLSEKYVGTSRPFLTDDPAEAIRFIEAQTVYNPITDDKSDQSAIGEIRYGLRTVKHWPAATTIMGSMPEGSREFRTLGSLAQAMNARGMPMRVATKDAGVNSAILQALGETQWRDHVQAIVHRQSEVNMTSVLRRLRRHFSCRDMANYDVLYSENSQGDIFLPGGTKIVSRFLHRLNEMQTGMAPVRPIVLIGRRFWTPILKMLSKQMNGFNPPLIKPKDMTLFVVTDSVRGAMDALMGSDSVPKATAAPGGARLAAQGESSGYRFQRPGTAQEPLKVVLIMPRSFSDTQSALPTRLPLSIMSVASCLKNPEFMRKIASSSKFAADLAHVPVIEPILIDLQAEAADFDLEKRLREINPDLVGVSAVTPFFPAAVDVLRIAERAAPQALRVTGGVHISALFKQSRPAFRLAMESSPSQMAVIGEGEEALAEAIVRIANGADLRGAPGFAFKDSANPAQIEEGPPGTRRIDWNEYPPVASSLGLLRLEGYQKWDTVAGYSFPAAAIMTVRGCRYRCKFCASKSTINGPVIALSADSIFKEMKAYYDAGFRFFFFVDDDFLIEHERFRQLALKIRQAGWSIGFNIMTRGDSVTDEMARLLKETGCTITALGAESGDQKLLDAVGKREKLETIAEATQILQRHKLHVRHYYMVGLPGQDWASILQTAEFIVKTRPDTANVSVALPYPGSDYFAKNAIEVVGPATYDRFLHEPAPQLKASAELPVITRTEAMNSDDIDRARRLLLELHKNLASPDRVGEILQQTRHKIRTEAGSAGDAAPGGARLAEPTLPMRLLGDLTRGVTGKLSSLVKSDAFIQSLIVGNGMGLMAYLITDRLISDWGRMPPFWTWLKYQSIADVFLVGSLCCLTGFIGLIAGTLDFMCVGSESSRPGYLGPAPGGLLSGIVSGDLDIVITKDNTPLAAARRNSWLGFLPQRRTRFRHIGSGDAAWIFVKPGFAGSIKIPRWGKEDSLDLEVQNLQAIFRMAREAGVEAQLRGHIPRTIEHARDHAVLDTPADAVDFARYCTEQTPSIDRRLEILCETARTLDLLHRMGVAHMDIKLHNVLVSETQSQLIDFAAAEFKRDSKFIGRTKQDIGNFGINLIYQAFSNDQAAIRQVAAAKPGIPEAAKKVMDTFFAADGRPDRALIERNYSAAAELSEGLAALRGWLGQTRPASAPAEAGSAGVAGARGARLAAGQKAEAEDEVIAILNRREDIARQIGMFGLVALVAGVLVREAVPTLLGIPILLPPAAVFIFGFSIASFSSLFAVVRRASLLLQKKREEPAVFERNLIRWIGIAELSFGLFLGGIVVLCSAGLAAPLVGHAKAEFIDAGRPYFIGGIIASVAASVLSQLAANRLMRRLMRPYEDKGPAGSRMADAPKSIAQAIDSTPFQPQWLDTTIRAELERELPALLPQVRAYFDNTEHAKLFLFHGVMVPGKSRTELEKDAAWIEKHGFDWSRFRLWRSMPGRGIHTSMVEHDLSSPLGAPMFKIEFDGNVLMSPPKRRKEDLNKAINKHFEDRLTGILSSLEKGYRSRDEARVELQAYIYDLLHEVFNIDGVDSGLNWFTIKHPRAILSIRRTEDELHQAPFGGSRMARVLVARGDRTPREYGLDNNIYLTFDADSQGRGGQIIVSLAALQTGRSVYSLELAQADRTQIVGQELVLGQGQRVFIGRSPPQISAGAAAEGSRRFELSIPLERAEWVSRLHAQVELVRDAKGTIKIRVTNLSNNRPLLIEEEAAPVSMVGPAPRTPADTQAEEILKKLMARCRELGLTARDVQQFLHDCRNSLTQSEPTQGHKPQLNSLIKEVMGPSPLTLELIEAMLRNPLFKELIGAADKKRNLRLAQQLRRMIEDRQTLWGSQRLSGMTEEQIMRQISDTEGLKRGIKLYDSADSDQEQAWRGLRDVIESALKRMQDEIRRRNLMPHGDKLYLIQAICLADEGEAVQAVALLGQKQQPRISIERARTFLGIWNDKKSREAALLALRLAYPEARRILDGDETRFVGPRMRMFDAENTWYTPQLRKDLEYLASLGGSRMASERSYPFKHVSTMGQLNQNGRQGNEYLSYLNRYRNQWGWINENYLPAMTRRNGEKREASVVSLGSSTGEELLRSFYQVGTYLDEADSGVNKWRVRADGYDRDPEICREGNLRIQGKKPFVGDLKASQDPYARDLIRYLNHHRRQAQAGMSLTAQDVLSVDRIRRQQPGADIVLVNHMIRNLPEASRQGFLRDVTRAWPDALVVVTDFPKDVDQATLTAQREVETQAADNPGDTSYFVLPRWLSHQSVTAARMSATPVRESREGVFNLPAAVESLARGLIARVGAQGVERLLEVLKEAETNPEAPKVAADLPTAFTYWSRHGRNEDFWPQLYLAVVYENQKIQAASPEGLLALLTGKIRDMEVVVAGIADAMEAAGVGGLTNEELGQAGTGYEQRLKGRVLEKIPDLKVSIKKAESACPNGYFDRLKQRMSDLEAKISASQMLGILRQERERRLYFKDKPWDGQIVFAVAGAGSVWSRDIWMSPRVAWQFLAQKRTDGFDLVRRVRELIEAQSGRVETLGQGDGRHQAVSESGLLEAAKKFETVNSRWLAGLAQFATPFYVESNDWVSPDIAVVAELIRGSSDIKAGDTVTNVSVKKISGSEIILKLIFNHAPGGAGRMQKKTVELSVDRRRFMHDLKVLMGPDGKNLKAALATKEIVKGATPAAEGLPVTEKLGWFQSSAFGKWLRGRSASAQKPSKPGPQQGSLRGARMAKGHTLPSAVKPIGGYLRANESVVFDLSALKGDYQIATKRNTVTKYDRFPRAEISIGAVFSISAIQRADGAKVRVMVGDEGDAGFYDLSAGEQIRFEKSRAGQIEVHMAGKRVSILEMAPSEAQRWPFALNLTFQGDGLLEVASEEAYTSESSAMYSGLFPVASAAVVDRINNYQRRVDALMPLSRLKINRRRSQEGENLLPARIRVGTDGHGGGTFLGEYLIYSWKDANGRGFAIADESGTLLCDKRTGLGIGLAPDGWLYRDLAELIIAIKTVNRSSAVRSTVRQLLSAARMSAAGVAKVPVSHLVGLKQRSELSEKEKVSRLILYYRLASNQISPEQYYRELRTVVDPRVQVRVDLGDDTIAEAVIQRFEIVGQQIGLDLIPLLAEPGISIRATDFINFALSEIKGLRRDRPDLTIDRLRDAFAKSLPPVRLYRGLRISKDKAMHMQKETGVRAEQTDKFIEANALQAFEEIRPRLSGLSEDEAKKIIYKSLNDPLDRNVGYWAYMMESIYNFGETVRNKTYRTDSLCVVQSATTIKKLAEDFIVGNQKDGRQQLAHQSGYVFDLEVPGIYVTPFTDEFPLITPFMISEQGWTDKDIQSAEEQKLRTSDGHLHNTPKGGFDYFIHIPILREYIKDCYPYQSNEGYRILKKSDISTDRGAVVAGEQALNRSSPGAGGPAPAAARMAAMQELDDAFYNQLQTLNHRISTSRSELDDSSISTTTWSWLATAEKDLKEAQETIERLKRLIELNADINGAIVDEIGSMQSNENRETMASFLLRRLSPDLQREASTPLPVTPEQFQILIDFVLENRHGYFSKLLELALIHNPEHCGLLLDAMKQSAEGADSHRRTAVGTLRTLAKVFNEKTARFTPEQVDDLIGLITNEEYLDAREDLSLILSWAFNHDDSLKLTDAQAKSLIQQSNREQGRSSLRFVLGSALWNGSAFLPVLISEIKSMPSDEAGTQIKDFLSSILSVGTRQDNWASNPSYRAIFGDDLLALLQEVNDRSEESQQIDILSFLEDHAGTFALLAAIDKNYAIQIFKNILQSQNPYRLYDFFYFIRPAVLDEQYGNMLSGIFSNAADRTHSFAMRILQLAQSYRRAGVQSPEYGKIFEACVEWVIRDHPTLREISTELGRRLLVQFAKENGIADVAITDETIEAWNLSELHTVFVARTRIQGMDSQYAPLQNLLDNTIKSALEGRFFDFITDPGSGYPMGKEIAEHNQRLREHLTALGIDVDKWLGYVWADREPLVLDVKIGALELQGNFDRINILLKELSDNTGPEGRGLIKNMLDKAGLEAREHAGGIRLVCLQGEDRANPTVLVKQLAGKQTVVEKNLNFIPNSKGDKFSAEAKAKAFHLNQEITDLIAAQKKHNEEKKSGATVKREFTTRVWKRDPARDLFQGSYTRCCIALDSPLHPEAIVEYLIDQGIQIVEILDATGRTTAQAFLVIGEDPLGSPVMVLDSIQIAGEYKSGKDQIRDHLLKRISQYAADIGCKAMYMGDTPYGDVDLEVAGSEIVPNRIAKAGGYLWDFEQQGFRYYLEALVHEDCLTPRENIRFLKTLVSEKAPIATKKTDVDSLRGEGALQTERNNSAARMAAAPLEGAVVVPAKTAPAGATAAVLTSLFVGDKISGDTAMMIVKWPLMQLITLCYENLGSGQPIDKSQAQLDAWFTHKNQKPLACNPGPRGHNPKMPRIVRTIGPSLAAFYNGTPLGEYLDTLSKWLDTDAGRQALEDTFDFEGLLINDATAHGPFAEFTVRHELLHLALQKNIGSIDKAYARLVQDPAKKELLQSLYAKTFYRDDASKADFGEEFFVLLKYPPEGIAAKPEYQEFFQRTWPQWVESDAVVREVWEAVNATVANSAPAVESALAAIHQHTATHELQDIDTMLKEVNALAAGRMSTQQSEPSRTPATGGARVASADTTAIAEKRINELIARGGWGAILSAVTNQDVLQHLSTRNGGQMPFIGSHIDYRHLTIHEKIEILAIRYGLDFDEAHRLALKFEAMFKTYLGGGPSAGVAMELPRAPSEEIPRYESGEIIHAVYGSCSQYGTERAVALHLTVDEDRSPVVYMADIANSTYISQGRQRADGTSMLWYLFDSRFESSHDVGSLDPAMQAFIVGYQDLMTKILITEEGPAQADLLKQLQDDYLLPMLHCISLLDRLERSRQQFFTTGSQEIKSIRHALLTGVGSAEILDRYTAEIGQNQRRLNERSQVHRKAVGPRYLSLKGPGGARAASSPTFDGTLKMMGILNLAEFRTRLAARLNISNPEEHPASEWIEWAKDRQLREDISLPYGEIEFHFRGLAELSEIYGQAAYNEIVIAQAAAAKQGRKAKILIIGVGEGGLLWEFYKNKAFDDIQFTGINKEPLMLPAEQLAVYLRDLQNFNGTAEQINAFQQRVKRDVVLCDLEDGLPFGDEQKFDVVIVANRVIQYLRNKLRLIDEIKKVLRADGVGFFPMEFFEIKDMSQADFIAMAGPEYRFDSRHHFINIYNRDPSAKLPELVLNTSTPRFDRGISVPRYHNIYSVVSDIKSPATAAPQPGGFSGAPATGGARVAVMDEAYFKSCRYLFPFKRETAYAFRGPDERDFVVRLGYRSALLKHMFANEVAELVGCNTPTILAAIDQKTTEVLVSKIDFDEKPINKAASALAVEILNEMSERSLRQVEGSGLEEAAIFMHLMREGDVSLAISKNIYKKTLAAKVRYVLFDFNSFEYGLDQDGESFDKKYVMSWVDDVLETDPDRFVEILRRVKQKRDRFVQILETNRSLIGDDAAVKLLIRFDRLPQLLLNGLKAVENENYLGRNEEQRIRNTEKKQRLLRIIRLLSSLAEESVPSHIARMTAGGGRLAENRVSSSAATPATTGARAAVDYTQTPLPTATRYSRALIEANPGIDQTPVAGVFPEKVLTSTHNQPYRFLQLYERMVEHIQRLNKKTDGNPIQVLVLGPGKEQSISYQAVEICSTLWSQTNRKCEVTFVDSNLGVLMAAAYPTVYSLVNEIGPSQDPSRSFFVRMTDAWCGLLSQTGMAVVGEKLRQSASRTKYRFMEPLLEESPEKVFQMDTEKLRQKVDIGAFYGPFEEIHYPRSGKKLNMVISTIALGYGLRALKDRRLAVQKLSEIIESTEGDGMGKIWIGISDMSNIFETEEERNMYGRNIKDRDQYILKVEQILATRGVIVKADLFGEGDRQIIEMTNLTPSAPEVLQSRAPEAGRSIGARLAAQQPTPARTQATGGARVADGARLAAESDLQLAFNLFYDITLDQAVLSSVEGINAFQKDEASLFALARAFVADPKVVRAAFAFNVAKTNVLMRMKQKGAEAQIEFLAAARFAEEAPLGSITLSEATLESARQANRQAKEQITAKSLQTQALPSLEAFSDRQRLMRDAKRAFVKSTSSVILRVAIDREGKRWTNGQLQNTLLEIEEVKTFLKDQNDRDNIKIQLVSLDGKTLYGDLSDPVEEGILQDPNVHIMYVGTFDDTLFDVALSLNGKAGYLASQALVNTDKESSSLLCAPAMLAAISMARTTPKSFESGSALDRILSSLIGASYAIGQRQNNYKTLYEITSPEQKQKNLNLLVRIVRLPINQYLAYTSLLIKAVGAAA